MKIEAIKRDVPKSAAHELGIMKNLDGNHGLLRMKHLNESVHQTLSSLSLANLRIDYSTELGEQANKIVFAAEIRKVPNEKGGRWAVRLFCVKVLVRH